MKLRLFLAPLLTALALVLTLGGVAAPAVAADGSVVTGLQVTVAQASADTWTITASWSSTEPGPFKLQIADDFGGLGTVFVTADVSGTSKTIVTDLLAGESTYQLAVKTRDGSDTRAVEAFQTPALDTVAPTGSFKLDRTSGYLVGGDLDAASSAEFRITQIGALEAGAVRQVVAGDGSGAKAWASGSGFTLRYTRAGTFTPKVVLTDQVGNRAEVVLPTVRALLDRVAPTLKITVPGKSNKVRSWRSVRGTASDAQTGVAVVVVVVMQKRGSVWWVYDFRKRKWVEGFATIRKTDRKVEAMPALLLPGRGGAWRTPRLKGLRAGLTRFQAGAMDNEFNLRVTRPVTRRLS